MKRPTRPVLTPQPSPQGPHPYKSWKECSEAYCWASEWIPVRSNAGGPAWLPLRPPEKVPLPQFPVHVLPEFVRNWVTAVSRANQTPVDLAAMLALAAGSAAAGNRARITAREGWTEPLTLFTAVLTEDGPRNSQLFTETMKPLVEWETQLNHHLARLDGDFADEPSLVPGVLPGNGQTRGSRLAEPREDDANSARQNEAGASGYCGPREDPRTKRRTKRHQRHDVATTSPQVLSRFHSDTSNKLLIATLQEYSATGILSPRGGLLRELAERNTMSVREQARILETAYDGGALTVSAGSRGFLKIDRPAIGCGLAIDPSLVSGKSKARKFAGQTLLSRFLFAMPSGRLGEQEIAPPPLDVGLAANWRAALRNVVTIEEPCELQLLPEAEKLLREWEGEIRRLLREGGPLFEIRGWGVRLAGATLRIAAILHLLARGASPMLDAMAMSAAIAIARYLIPHALAALEQMGVLPPRPETLQEYLIRWLKRHGIRNFRSAQAYQELRRQFESSYAIELALEEFVARGYVRLVPPDPKKNSKGGRPRSKEYEVNPALFAPPAEATDEELPKSPDYPWRDVFFPSPLFVEQEPELTEQEATLIRVAAEQARQSQFEIWLCNAFRTYKAALRSLRRKRERLARQRGEVVQKTAARSGSRPTS